MPDGKWLRTLSKNKIQDMNSQPITSANGAPAAAKVSAHNGATAAAPAVVEDETLYEVEKIVHHRVIDNEIELLVKWVGFEKSDWLPFLDFQDAEWKASATINLRTTWHSFTPTLLASQLGLVIFQLL